MPERGVCAWMCTVFYCGVAIPGKKGTKLKAPAPASKSFILSAAKFRLLCSIMNSLSAWAKSLQHCSKIQAEGVWGATFASGRLGGTALMLPLCRNPFPSAHGQFGCEV